LIDGSATVYAEIGTLPGVYATGSTVEQCRGELRRFSRNELLLGLSMRHYIPPIDGIELRVREAS
jgi:hypothetical protein